MCLLLVFSSHIIRYISSFVPSVISLYPPKTIRKYSDLFRGYENATLGTNASIQCVFFWTRSTHWFSVFIVDFGHLTDAISCVYLCCLLFHQSSCHVSCFSLVSYNWVFTYVYFCHWWRSVYFTYFSTVSIVDFEHKFVCWE